MSDLLSVNALANRDFILLSLVTRFATNLITLIGALWSYIEYGNPERPADSTDDSGLYGLVVLIFLFFAVLFVNDISSLPVNIFYFWSFCRGLQTFRTNGSRLLVSAHPSYLQAFLPSEH